MMLESLLDGLTYVFSVVTLILTGLMLLSYRKPKKFKYSSAFSSIARSLVTLLLFVLISGARLNFVIAVVLLILGGVWGAVRGMTVKLYPLDDQIMVRNSMLSLAGWGGSLAISSLFSSFDSALLAAIGLIPLFFSTATSVGNKSTVMVRRLLMGQKVT
jgi:hypothetical protein